MGLVSLIALVASGGYSGMMLTDDPFYKRNDLASIPLPRLLAVVYVTFSILMAGPLAVAGWAILRWKQWGKSLGMVAASVNMLHFPIGTLVGAYTIWVLHDEATEFLFANAPAGGVRR